ncbi:uncharacterized protein SETTUDRAFT_163547, partial [Exserohilum turcica Et28A]
MPCPAKVKASEFGYCAHCMLSLFVVAWLRTLMDKICAKYLLRRIGVAGRGMGCVSAGGCGVLDVWP